MAAELRFAKTHEWIRPEADGLATVGISAYAVEALTDLVFMQLPNVGRKVKAGESIGEIGESPQTNGKYRVMAPCRENRDMMKRRRACIQALGDRRVL